MSKQKSLHVVLAIAILIVFVGMASYAYFTSLIDNDASSEITVITHTTDSFVFTMGDELELEAHQENFGPEAEDLITSSTSTVALTASSSDTSTHCYNVNLVISDNEFIYTTPENTPELLFKIVKNNITLVDNLDITTAGAGSTYTHTIPTVSGGGVYKHQIVAPANQTTTDTFVASITFVNLNESQNANTGKSISGTVEFSKTDC